VIYLLKFRKKSENDICKIIYAGGFLIFLYNLILYLMRSYIVNK